MRFNQSDIYLSKNKKVEKEFTDLFNNIVVVKPLENGIKLIFIDKNNIFDPGDITNEDKKFVNDLFDRTEFSF